MAKIYWQSKGKLSAVEEELGSEFTMGRAKDNNLFLLDPHLSRHHARIFQEEEKYIIEDLNSRNGTSVNGALIIRHELQPGDEIQLGETVIRFEKPFEDDKEAPYLLMLEGLDEGKTFSLRGNKFTVGRKPENNLVLNDFRVSGNHVQFLRKPDDSWTIEDLGTKNGTFVNGKKIKQEDLKHGNILSIGGIKIRFLLPGLPVPPIQKKAESIVSRQVPEMSHQKQLVINILMIIALGAIFWAGYGVAGRMFTNNSGLVASSGNVLREFYSFEKGVGKPDGWIARSGVVFKKSGGGLPPGRFAAHVRNKDPRPDLPGIVKYYKPVLVVSGRVYELRGYCSVKGKGAGCLAVRWIDPSGREKIDYGEVCGSGRSAVMSSLFQCPPQTQKAEIDLVVFGGAEVVFDQVELIKTDSKSGSGPGGSNPIKKTLKEGDFLLSVGRNGPFDLFLSKELVLGEARLQIDGALPGLPGEALGFGNVQREQPAQGSATGLFLLNARKVFIPDLCEWIPLQKEYELNNNGGRVTWKIPRDKIKPEMRLAFVFDLPEDLLGGKKRFSVYGPLGKRDVSLKELPGLKLSELIVKGLPHGKGIMQTGRIVLSFPGVGTVLRQGNEFVVYVEKEIHAEIKQNMLSVGIGWSFTSSYEIAHINKVIDDAKKFELDGMEGKAVSSLKNLLSSYNLDKEKQKAIRKFIDSNIKKGKDFLKQASIMNSDLSKSGDSTVLSALLPFLGEIKSRFEGCSEITDEAQKYIMQLSQRKKASSAQESNARIEDYFSQVRKFFMIRRYASAYLVSRRILGTSSNLDEKTKQQFTDFFNRIKLRLTNKAYLPPLKKKETGE